MLYKVEIENFYSVGHRQEIDLRVRKSVDDTLGRLSPVFTDSADRAPNVVTLFGPNAAGKSNVLRAIAFGVWFILNSFDHRTDRSLPYEKFGSVHMISEPTRLSFTFAWPKDYQNPTDAGPTCPYTYELVLSPRAENEPEEVVFEKLCYQAKGSGKPTTILQRSNTGVIKAAKGFLTSGTEKALNEILRPRASLITTLAQLNNKFALALIESVSGIFSNILINRFENDERDVAVWYGNNSDALAELQRIARRIDLGIEEVIVDTRSGSPELLFQHSGLDQIIGLNRESHGTQQFIKVLPQIFMALARGGIAIVDEIDSAMHPMILPEILRWFGDEVRNPNGAQLWTTCHSASLLTELTKEEVLLCEKDPQGNTNVYKLSDIEGVRRDENFFGKYLGGEYGAVPALG